MRSNYKSLKILQRSRLWILLKWEIIELKCGTSHHCLRNFIVIHFTFASIVCFFLLKRKNWRDMLKNVRLGVHLEMKFIEMIKLQYLNLMVKLNRSIVKIYVTLQNYFWTIKLCTMI